MSVEAHFKRRASRADMSPQVHEAQLQMLEHVLGESIQSHVNYYPTDKHLRFSIIFRDSEDRARAQEALESLNFNFTPEGQTSDPSILAGSLYGIEKSVLNKSTLKDKIKFFKT